MGKRKAFTVLLLIGSAGAFLASPIACRQQSNNKGPGESAKKGMPTIGVATYGAHPILDVIVDAFKKRLHERGYEEGKNVTVLWKSVEGDVNLTSSVAQTLLNSNADVIVTITTPISQGVYKVAKGKVPIVFSGVTDPISAGLVDSWENKPGSGITGTSDRWPYVEQLDLIRALLPHARKIGFPYNAGEANSQYAFAQVTKLAGTRGLEIIPSVATNPTEVRRAAESLADQGADVIYVSSDNTVMAGFDAVLKVSHERKLPVVVGESANVERGGLATYSVDYGRLGQSTADLVIRVLEGEDPGTIPVVTFEGEELYLNLDAAKQMGVEIPDALKRKAYKIYGEPASNANRNSD
jgi:putative ABC transport system substrate-binding protein